MAQSVLVEGSGTIATLTRTGDLSQPLTVTLDSSDPTEVTIPPSAIIPAGEASVTFPVGAIDDADADGVQSVNLLAWVDGEPGTAYAMLSVFDNDSPPIAQPDNYNAGEDETLTVSGFGVLGNDYGFNGDLFASVVTSPSHGTLTLDPVGGFTYTPAPNYFGPDSFTYRATDLAGLSDEANVSLTVWEMNDPLILTAPGPQATAEETPLTFSAVNGNAITITDVDSPRLLVSLLASGGTGILTLQSTAGLEFPYFPNEVNNSPAITFYADSPAEATAALEGLVLTPVTNHNGPIYFDVNVRDETYPGFLISVYATIPVSVTPVNDAPVAVADDYLTTEDMPLTGTGSGVLVNDTDPEYDPISASLVSAPSHGTVTLNPNGSFTYVPDTNYNGPDNFTYRATDSGGLSSVATVSIDILAQDDFIEIGAPGPQATVEDTPITFSAANGNAITIIDPESPRVYVNLLANGFTGILTLQSTAGLEFPYPNEVNNSPTITFIADNPAEANAALEGLVLTPNPDLNGQITLCIFARDETYPGSFVTQIANVPIAITPVNDAPVAVDDVVVGPEDLQLFGSVHNNDSDPELQTLTPVLVSGPSHGTLILEPSGNFHYAPAPNYYGTDSFTYRASDGTALSNVATVTITVTPVNDAPAAGDDAYELLEDSTLTVSPAGLLTNDTDVEADPLTAVLFSGPSHGTVTVNPNGGFTYVPNANFAGVDTFRYQASDGIALSDVATVTITVNGVNDTPVNVVPGTQTLLEDTTVTFSAANGNAIRVTDLDAGDSVVELRLSVNGFLTFPTTTGLTFATGSNGGNLITVRGTPADLNAALDGLVFRPGANFTGNYSLQVRTSDLGNSGSGGTQIDTDTVALSITPVNDAPRNVVPLITPVTAEDTPLTFSPPIWVTDVDQTTGAYDSPVRVTLEFAAGAGTLTVTPAAGVTITGNGTDRVEFEGRIVDVNTALGTLTFAPAANANNLTAPVQIRMATDDQANGGPGALTDTDVFAISVTPVNDAPTTSGLPAVAVNEDAPPTSVTLTNYFADVEDGPTGLTYSVVGNTNPGLFSSVTVADGVLTLTYAPNLNGSATLTVRATDSGGLWVESAMAVTVSPVNDAPTSPGLPPVFVNEDTQPTSVTLTDHFADIEDGPSGLTYAVVDNTNPGLFSSLSVSGGVLTLSYAANAYGSATMTVRATDSGGLSVDVPLAVTVSPVNDAPTSAGLPAVSVAEDAPPTSVSMTDYFADIEDGPAGLSYTVVANSNPGLFGSVSVSGGVLTSSYAANAYGSATLTIRATDSGGLWVEAPLAVTVTPVNDAPTSSGLPPVSVNEDAAPTEVTLTNHFADIEDGPAGLTYSVVSNTNPDLFSSVSVANGVLTLSYAPNANGSATLTVRGTDSDGMWVETPFLVTVSAVNDAPTTPGLPPVSVLEDAAPTTVTLTNYFADVEDGPTGLTYAVVNNTNPGLFNSVSLVNGVLTLGYAPNANGTATLTIRATDSGGLWVETPLAVSVSPVNDAPTTGGLPSVSVLEDASATAVTLTNYFADIEDSPAGLSYAVVNNTNPGLFGSVSIVNGILTAAYAPNANGSATLTVRATDGGGLWVEAPLAVTVAAVNDAPSFTAGSNVMVASDAGAQTVAGWATAISGGPADEGTQSLNFSVSTDSPLLFAVQPAINPATGVLTFSPVAGASGTATATVVLRDDGGTANGGADASTPATFTITLTPPAWAPGAQVFGSELIIVGGSGNDSVTVMTGGGGVKVTGTLNGQSVNKTFRQTLSQIRVSTGDGNDTVTIGDGITLPTAVDAGAGDDSVKGGGGSDLIVGGTGNDTINGAAGDDDVDAGAGNDSVIGGLGRDLVLGQAGNDVLQGGDGNDFLIGGLGADQLFGQNGHDILVAGAAAVRDPSSDSLRQVLTDWDPAAAGIYDALRGRLAVTDDPASPDSLQGNAGTDWFWSADPSDLLDLGAGEQQN